MHATGLDFQASLTCTCLVTRYSAAPLLLPSPSDLTSQMAVPLPLCHSLNSSPLSSLRRSQLLMTLTNSTLPIPLGSSTMASGCRCAEITTRMSVRKHARPRMYFMKLFFIRCKCFSWAPACRTPVGRVALCAPSCVLVGTCVRACLSPRSSLSAKCVIRVRLHHARCESCPDACR
jgi:hypothetical protein